MIKLSACLLALLGLGFLPLDVSAVTGEEMDLDTSVYENRLQFSYPALEAARVIKVKIDEEFSNGSLVVVEANSQMIVPSLVIQEAINNLHPTFIVSNPENGVSLPELSDNLPTYVDYPVKEPGPTNYFWELTLDQPQTISGLFTGLRPYSAEPSTWSIIAIDPAGEIYPIQLNKPFAITTRFPSRQVKVLKVNASLDQPVRIADFLLENDAPITQEHALLFVAEPQKQYEVFLNPSLPVDFPSVKAPHLSTAPNPLTTKAVMIKNPSFKLPDRDDDEILDKVDNCLTISNYDQIDTNKNGVGDACEDTDQDGIIDPLDNCPIKANNMQENIDRDNQGDVCDDFDNRLTEQLPWLPWAAISVVGICIAILFYQLLKSPKLDPPPPGPMPI